MTINLVQWSQYMHKRGVEQMAARWAHNPEVVGSSPASATSFLNNLMRIQ